MFECIPARVVLAIVSFFGFQCLYLIRINLSVLAVDMVRYTPLCNTTDIHSNAISVLPELDDTSNKCPTVDENNEVNWTPSQKGLVLGSFFYGYACTQILGGRIAELYGASRVFCSSVVIPALLTFLLPISAKYHYGMAMMVRVFQGAFQGTAFPSMHALISKWIPLLERSRYVGIIYIASTLGLVIAMPLCGFLSDMWSWETAFYVTGLIPIVWAPFSIFLTYDTPKKHPRISAQELLYIETSVSATGTSLSKIPQKIPWKSIMTSLPFIAIIVCDMGNSYGLTTLATQIPSYFSEKFQINSTKIGLLSAAPFLFRYLGSVLQSTLGDYLISSKKLSVTSVRRYFSVIAMIGPTIFISLVPSAENMLGTLILLCCSNFTNGAISISQLVNHTDIAPNFSGTLFGISNTFASIAALLSPTICGVILGQNGGNERWNWVFWHCAPLYLVSEVFYFFYVSGHVQHWNMKSHEVDLNDQELL